MAVSEPSGKATGMMYQSLPNTVANSVTSKRPMSSGAVSTAPKSTEASSNSHQRAAGIPRKVIGAGSPAHDCNGASSASRRSSDSAGGRSRTIRVRRRDNPAQRAPFRIRRAELRRRAKTGIPAVPVSTCPSPTPVRSPRDTMRAMPAPRRAPGRALPASIAGVAGSAGAPAAGNSAGVSSAARRTPSMARARRIVSRSASVSVRSLALTAAKRYADA